MKANRSGLVTGRDGARRCWWAAGQDDYLEYHDSEWGFPVVQVKVVMTNQDGGIVVTSVNEVELPY